MLKKIRKIISRNKGWIFLLSFICVFGAFLTYSSFVKPVGMGDPATFASFGCNISKGEVIYRDFYHFRTPGEYFVNGLFAKIRGCGMDSVMLALTSTQFIFAPIIIVAALYVLNKKNIKLAWIVYLVLIHSAVSSQFRIAFGFLAVSFMIDFLVNGYKKKKFNSLYLAGFFTGVTFIFGQDIAILAGFLFTVSTIYASLSGIFKKNIKDTFLLFVRFGAGFLLGILPLILYLMINGVLLKGLYYTLYYAIFLQPGGMDIPYPTIFEYKNLIFYVPIVILTLGFLLIISKGGKRNIPLLMILCWSILRFISASGRSDYGHLQFGIFPEVIVLISMMLEFSRSEFKISRRSIIACIAFVVLFLLSIFVKSFLLFGVVIAVLAFDIANNKRKDRGEERKFELFEKVTIILASIIAFNMILPGLFAQMYVSKAGVRDRSGQISKRIPAHYARIKNFIDSKKPKYIFSYAVHPYFYTIGYKHATPFMTFEPQTTQAEQEEAITHLKKNKPEVVIFDPLQAYDMGKSIDKITNYILNNYQIEAIDDSNEVVWMMVPEKHNSKKSFVSINIKKFRNTDNIISVENNSLGIRLGLLQKPNSESTIGNLSIKNLKFEVFSGDKSSISVLFKNGNRKDAELKKGHSYDFGDREIEEIKIVNNSDSDLVLNKFIAEEVSSE